MIAAPKVSTNSVIRSFGSSLMLKICLYAAVAFSLTAAVTHLWVTPGHFSEWWGYGAFFAVAALAQGIYAILLLRAPGRKLYLAGIAGNLAIVSGFVAAYTAGMPLGPHAGAAHPMDALGIVATGSELALVLALVVLSGSFSAARTYVLRGAVLAFGSGLVLHALYAGTHAAQGFSPVLHWAWNSLLALPLAVLVIWLATYLSRRILLWSGLEDSFSSRITWALVVSAAYAGASIPSDIFAMPKIGTESFLVSALGDGGAVLGAAFLLLYGLASMLGLPWDEPKTINFWRPRAAAVAAGLVAAVAVVAGPSLIGQDFSKPAVAQAGQACTGASYDRSYDVAAINVEIPFNRWGDMDPDGMAYVLQGDKEAVKNWYRPLAADPASDPAGNRRLRPRPLVIRANAGECVKIDFKNELNPRQWSGRLVNPRASMQVRGIAYDAQTSDGGAIGFNKDTTVGVGESTSYYWKAPDTEGLHIFRSQTMTSGEEEDAGSNSHGMYGAFAVQPTASTWTDPETGQPVYEGENDHSRITKNAGDPYIDADIHPAGQKSFRETVQLAQDYSETAPGQVGHGFNYGTEPQRNREKEDRISPDGVGEEVSLSSWVYGDPALVKLASGKGPWLPEKDANGKPVTDTSKIEDCGLEDKPLYAGGPTGKGSCYTANVSRAYQGDPTKIRYAMAGAAETHVFHLHAHQWLNNPNETPNFNTANPDNPKSSTIDSQTFGPGESFTADLLYGAGSQPKTFGDSIFHCHLYPHFAEGFWSLFRVHDVKEDGTGKLPDGTKVRNLQPLPGGTNPPEPTADNPGYPRFIPGEYGWRAPQPPKSISEQKDQNAPFELDNPNTVEREDLKPATRIVAGKPLDTAQLDTTNPLEQRLADKLAVEQKVLDRNGGGKPGAPFVEPCPTGSREVTYNVSVMQRDVVYNKRGDHDTQARFVVLDKDVPKMLEKNPDGSYKNQPEPLFFRANAGDCINYNLTNLLPNWIGNDAFLKMIQTNMMGEHIHLVKFDVMASDGATNGWNYQQAAFTKEQADFNNKVASGQEQCDEQNGCTIPNPPDWNPAWDGGTGPNAGIEPGQTITERWFADYELRTVFSHDHHFAAVDQNRGMFSALLVEAKNMNFRNPKSGEFYQPGNGNVPNAPNCGSECVGTAAGAAMDVIGPGANDDFREFGLAYQDFVSLTKKGGDPRNRDDVYVGPNAPENYPDEDPGVVGINYRSAPLNMRETKNGRKTDPAHYFSSTVHGDPDTPLLEAYSEDPVQVRLMQGSQEHQHTFSMNGMRWREDPDNPNSPLVSSQDLGVSEAFNFKVPRITCGAGDEKCMGDYLYSSQNIDDLYMGMWGIMRAYGKVDRSRLLPLPDNDVPEGDAPITPQAITPPESNSPGNPCKVGAPTKKFNVVAMDTRIQYNKQGDHDPFGLMYALAEDEQAIRSGAKKPEPLVLRANEGDCIEVRLTNKISPSWLQKHPNAGTQGDAMSPMENVAGTPAGLRVGLNPQLVKYDVRGSDGTAVGYNPDQTVAPGNSRLYRWYADDVSPGELGTINLTDFGDVRGHRHHGLYAGLTIEPKGAKYHDPQTGAQIDSGVSADVRVPGADNDFREFTPFFSDGLNLRDKNGAIIDMPEEPGAALEPPGVAHDHIDQGEKGFGYSSAPFRHRLPQEAGLATEANPMNGEDMANVYNSRVHGDPDTPIFRAYAGDDVRMRVLQGADKQRQHSFEMLGHGWYASPEDSGTPVIGSQGGFSVSRALNVQLLGGAGNGYAGDYRYADGMYRHNLSGGSWGLMRVYPQPAVAAALDPTPLLRVDNPLKAGNHPILPLETNATLARLSSLEAKPARVVFGKATTLSGNLTSGNRILANQPVILEQKPAGARSFSKLGSPKSTDRSGAFSFSVKPRKHTEYRAVFAGDEQSGLRATTSPTQQVKVKVKVTSKVSSESIKKGRAVTISGAVAPKHGGRAKLVIKRGSKQVAVKAVALKNSSYSFRYKPNRPGVYTVRANFRSDRDHLGNNSPTSKFRVVR